MFKWRSIQLQLFVYYSMLVLTIIVVFSIIFYSNISRTLISNASSSLQSQADAIGFQADEAIEEMNLLSGKLLFSEQLIALFYSDLFENKPEIINKRHEFNSLVYSITGPQSPPYQVNMFRLSGEYVEIGNTSNFSVKPNRFIQSIPWLDSCMNLHGSMLVTGPHSGNTSAKAHSVISVCRSFAPYWGGKKDSVLEIQIEYSEIEALVRRNLSDTSQNKAYLFNDAGDCIYPLQSSPAATEYFQAIRAAQGTGLLTHFIDGEERVLAFTKLDKTNWTVVVAQTKGSLFLSVNRFRIEVIIVTIVVLLLLLLITYSISRGLAIPIQKIHQTVRGLTFETLPNEKFAEINANVNELEELNKEFQRMCQRLRLSLDETVSARSMEIQSRMLALQAQMNPHFLYNTLATISILAEKEEPRQITQVCDSLSDMLRYISSGSDSMVTMDAELQHTHRYLQLIHIRFADDAIFHIDVANELLQIPIPKLTIQPLVENCIKYATSNTPPWHISIHGALQNEKWWISVSDNGAGFSEVALENIKSKMIDVLKVPKQLSLDGMGLINIYTRLFLRYDKDTIFEFGNHPDGGAFVIIGGSIDRLEGAYDNATPV